MPYSVRTLKPCQKGRVSRPATGEFLGTRVLQRQSTVASHAPLTAGLNSPLSWRRGPAIIPQELVAENGLFQTKLILAPKNSRNEPLFGPARGKDEATNPMPFAYKPSGALTQPGSL